MTSAPQTPRWIIAATAGLLVATFAIDLLLPSGVAVSVCYVAAVLLGLWSPRSRHAIITAGVATVLTTIAIAIEPGGGVGTVAALNHLFALVGIWTAALVTWWHRQVRDLADVSRRSLADYKTALDQASIVAITDRRGIIRYVNDKFCEISRYPREELIGQDHRILNSRYHPKAFFQELWGTIGRGRVWRGEIRNRAKDGSIYWVDTVIVPFLNEAGQPVQYVAIRTDITQRKVAQAALFEQESLARLGSMAAVVAHEVKNPLAGIAGALRIIGRRLPAGGDEQAVIDEMLGRIGALDAMVNEMLQFARPRTPRLAPVELTAIARETAALIASDDALAGVSIDVDGDGGTLAGDPDMLRQALTNVILNAAQAAGPSGHVRVRVTIGPSESVVVVTDDGPGIAPDVGDRVFEPFVTTRSRGTGLGLPLARRHVEAHGGTLAIVPSPTGACVEMRLPQRRVQG